MVEEQEGLLAGKYKTTDDLEKAYLELQKKQGQPQTNEEEVSEDPAPEQLDPSSFYQEDGAVNYETANQVYGDQISKQFKDNNIDPFKMNEYFMENDGQLSDEMYGDLQKAGFNQDMVDSYLKGVRESYGMAAQEAEAPVLSASNISNAPFIAFSKADLL